ncbi:HupE/UreJ family protein [Neobacillus sp. PS3-34]|uniref:HupE/UreJ family protein n=1 Tax=Neobacillus sp. PS3-34 TaxID=3070678 RepID=UPI0027E17AEC|nr:HupE/UreJ family protein [Neobacillus sp. PS3-34]WML50608.1 HupE/UreJ family protein [Neobacillus sp. PS3-34]
MKYYPRITNRVKTILPKRIIFSSFVTFFLLMLYLPQNTFAHNYSASFTNLDLNKKSTKATFSIDTISVIELIPGVDKNKNYVLSRAEVKSGKNKIESVIIESLALDKNNKELTPNVKKMKLVKKQNKIFLSFYLTYPAFAPGDTISYSDGLYSGDSGTTNYVDLLTAKYAGGTSEAAIQGTDRTWTMLLTEDQQEQQTMDGQAGQPDSSQVQAQQPKAEKPAASSWLSFFKLGIFHILTGYDHLLFLLALLIGRQTVKQYIGTVTAFTIAHSITLTLAVLGIADIPSKLVESCIALSICYVAIENIFKRKINYRWAITFGFGLIHGLGFASILKDMNLPKSNLAVALINFNLGIEFIQLLIVLLIIPVLMKLQKAVKYRDYMRIGSVLIFILGLIWLIQRLFA